MFGDRLAEVWLFGSRALGTHRPDSDVDLLAVLTEEGPIGSELDRLCSVAQSVWRSHRVHINGHPTTIEDIASNDDSFTTSSGGKDGG